MSTRLPRWYVYIVKVGHEFAYVGKGSGQRWLVSARERRGIAGIVEFFAREKDAHARECELIAQCKPRLNRSAGGEGRSQKIKRDTDAYWGRKWRQESYKAADSNGNLHTALLAAAFARSVLNEKGIKDIAWPVVAPERAQEDPEVLEAVKRLNAWNQLRAMESLRSPSCSPL